MEEQMQCVTKKIHFTFIAPVIDLEHLGRVYKQERESRMAEVYEK